ncbi:MAG TPA: hypothetical protein VIG33_13130 [Pseudobdellovibrionaceae bacterium]|jgi:hypothetical protein
MRLLGLIFCIGLAFHCDIGAAKPFKKVLVISGGGVNPGLALGIIAGVQEKGWRPDLIIATCGAGIGSAIYNSEQSIAGSFEVLRSWEFYKTLSRIEIETPNGLDMFDKLKKAKNTFVYPSLFAGNLLHAPEEFFLQLKNPEFNQNPALPKVIILSARAFFGPSQVGQVRPFAPIFQQVYFTDAGTAEYLKGRKLPKKYSYPFTTLTEDTLAISEHDTITASRAGGADPYLLNPSLVDGYYHFSGAVDLFPLDLAVSLGDEVVATYPASLFQDYEDVAVVSGFGFKQTTRALEAIQHKDVKWIDISGADDLSFNPSRLILLMRSGIPTDFTEFQLGVGKQWSFGRDRANEAIRMASGKVTDIRFHLRKPINPKLAEDFSCKNANEWKTDQRDSCVNDKSAECNRALAKKCVPIR